jgi:DNA primase
MNYDPDAAGQNAMRRSIDLLLAKGLRIRILKLAAGLDPDDFVRKEGGEVYRRLLDKAPYFWQYLMTEAAHQYDLDDPAMKATAVNDVVQHVAKIQDRIEQLEVARAVAEGFKVPEPVIFDRLNLTPRRPGLGESRPPRPPGIRGLSPNAEHRLTPAEKQLIQALLQDLDIARALQPALHGEFLSHVWSAPVLENLVKEPGGNVEKALESVKDEELRKEVRAAVLEPFGRISADEALSSITRLNNDYLVKKRIEILDQLRQYGNGAAPDELVEKHQKIVRELSRLGAVKA